MTEVAALALTFPTVAFTVLLGVVLAYWVFVMFGVLHVGEGHGTALDGFDAGDALAGASKGALEGAAKGALEGATKGAIETAVVSLSGHAGAADAVHHAVHHADIEPELGGEGGHPGMLAAMLSALRLRQIPATIALSVLVTFCWLVCIVAMQILSRGSTHGSATWLRLAVLLASPVVALPLSSLVCVPLGKMLEQRAAPTKRGLIGMTCRVRTGKVTARFGEATLDDGGPGLVVRVHVDGETTLKRGDLALIVDFDREQDSFLIVAMDTVIGATNQACR